MNLKKINTFFIASFILLTPLISLAELSNPTIFGYKLNCDPSKSPTPGKGGCNFENAIGFIKYILANAYIVALGITVLMIIWAGFKIIFAGAKGEDYKDGAKLMQNAVIGLAIVLSAGLIVKLIVNIFS